MMTSCPSIGPQNRVTSKPSPMMAPASPRWKPNPGPHIFGPSQRSAMAGRRREGGACESEVHKLVITTVIVLGHLWFVIKSMGGKATCTLMSHFLGVLLG